MIIHPEVIVAPDRPIVRFREPREAIKLDEELPKILHRQGWNLGTFFDIQFLNYEKTKLLSSATFIVTEWHENLLTSEADPYKPMTRTVFSSKAKLVGEWWYADEKVDRQQDKLQKVSEDVAAIKIDVENVKDEQEQLRDEIRNNTSVAKDVEVPVEVTTDPSDVEKEQREKLGMKSPKKAKTAAG